MGNNNRKKADKRILIEPSNLSDLNTKFIEGFNIGVTLKNIVLPQKGIHQTHLFISWNMELI